MPHRSLHTLLSLHVLDLPTDMAPMMRKKHCKVPNQRDSLTSMMKNDPLVLCCVTCSAYAPKQRISILVYTSTLPWKHHADRDFTKLVTWFGTFCVSHIMWVSQPASPCTPAALSLIGLRMQCSSRWLRSSRLQRPRLMPRALLAALVLFRGQI